jgi:hypothetical protein
MMINMRSNKVPGIQKTQIRILRIFILLLFLVSSCKKEKENHLFTLMDASDTHASFVNHLDYERQIKTKFNIYTYRNFYNGGGVALGDVNNDGLIDIFLTANMGPNALYLNKGNFEFEDISEKAGITGIGQWSTGVSFADVDGDGWLDIYVCNSGILQGEHRRNELYINNGDLTFSEKAKEYGIDDGGNSTHGLFFDYDKDGDLDLYLLKNAFKAIGSFNLKEDLRSPRDSVGGDKLFRNDGHKFTDVSAEAGIYGSIIGFGMGATVGDINNDNWMDIYVSNDFFERDYIYLNNHNGTFTENLTNMIRSTSAASMGADIADVNNDLFLDLFVTDMLPEPNYRVKTKTTFDSWESYKFNMDNGYHHQFTRNMLHLNNTDSTFSEIGRLAGVCSTDWSWGALMMDLDNDGLKDLFVANGIFKDLTDQDYLQLFASPDMVMQIVSGNTVDYRRLIDAIPSVKIPNYAFRNNGDYTFSNVASSWGLANPSFSNGSAYGDLDNDGDLDLVINNVNTPVFIYRNETNIMLQDNHYLKVILKGEAPNTSAFGSKVIVKHNGKYVFLEQMPARGFQSSVDPRPNLGLGSLLMVDSLIVIWPDEKVTILNNVKTNQILTLYQKDASDLKLQLFNPVRRENKYFKDLTAEMKIGFKHREDDFNDFERDHLLNNMMSTEGPHICKGDVNKDGLDDIYICGAKGQPGALMIQKADGTFVPSDIPLFEADKISEDVDCAMFDADNDGDPDLYVASGGNSLPESSSALADRLYLNNGKGHFTKSPQVLPAGKYENSGCVQPCDYDRDGVIELFVGIRLIPFAYGVPVNGYLLENDGKGNFTNVTSEIAPELLNVGMIRDMAWSDVNGDGKEDIILAGDWMALKVFLNKDGRFTELKDAFGTEKTEGWWNCITATDLDGDKDIDFIAGNTGLNTRFKATPAKPITMYVSDFDLNGSIEQVISAFNGDTSFPIALKHDMTKQIPALYKKYPKYDMIKDQRVTDMFSEERLKNSILLKVYLAETSMFLNDGTGHFSRKQLPTEIQFSSVYAITTGDYNDDGYLDILMGGNLYNVKPEIGRYDASYGSLLTGNSKGDFVNVPARISGLYLEGEVRDIIEINTAKGKILMVARNNDELQLYKIKCY